MSRRQKTIGKTPVKVEEGAQEEEDDDEPTPSRSPSSMQVEVGRITHYLSWPKSSSNSSRTAKIPQSI
jgi:hypothetical protein